MLIVQLVVHSDQKDIRAELVVGIGVDPTEIVHKSRPVLCRNEGLLKRCGDAAEGQINLIAGERNARERVGDDVRKQF